MYIRLRAQVFIVVVFIIFMPFEYCEFSSKNRMTQSNNHMKNIFWFFSFWPDFKHVMLNLYVRPCVFAKTSIGLGVHPAPNNSIFHEPHNFSRKIHMNEWIRMPESERDRYNFGVCSTIRLTTRQSVFSMFLYNDLLVVWMEAKLAKVCVQSRSVQLHNFHKKLCWRTITEILRVPTMCLAIAKFVPGQ